MKKIVYYIITIFSITNYCYSQNPIIDLDEWNGDNFPNGSYYKDTRKSFAILIFVLKEIN